MLPSWFRLPRIFSGRWCAARNLFYFRTLMFITLFLLCLQTWLIWVWAFSAGTKASYSVHFIDAQTFHNTSVYIPLFLWIQFKINGSYLGFFREICLLCLLWSCFLSIVIAILKTRDFGYLHQIVTKLRSLLILLSVIWYQLSFVCYCHLFHLLISFFFSLCHLCAVLGCQIVA